MATNRPVTDHLTRWLITHSGFREAYHALTFVACWGIARKHYPEGMTVDDYGDYWELSRSQAFRHQARFRKALHGFYESADPICDALEEEWPKVFASDDPDQAMVGILDATL